MKLINGNVDNSIIQILENKYMRVKKARIVLPTGNVELDNLSKVVILVGPNGAGKSQLLKEISNLLEYGIYTTRNVYFSFKTVLHFD